MKKAEFSDDALRLAASRVRDTMLAALPEPEECRPVFSLSFLQRMEKLLRHDRRLCAVRRLGRRVATVAVTVFAAASIWLSVDTEARAAVVNWVREVYENSVIYRFPGENTAAEALPRYEITALPEGYDMTETTELSTMCVVSYENGEDMIIFFYEQMTDDGHLQIFLKEPDYLCCKIKVGDFTGEFYMPFDESQSNELIWRDEMQGILFQISAFADADTLIAMAESVKSTG